MIEESCRRLWISDAAMPIALARGAQRGWSARFTRSCEIARDVDGRPIRNELREDGFGSADHRVESMLCDDCAAHLLAQTGIPRQARSQPSPSRAQQVGIVRWHDLAELADDWADIADIGGDHRNAARHRLPDHVGKPFAEG